MLVAGALLCAGSCTRRSAEALRPDLSYEILGSPGRSTIGDLRGQAVLVNFFASWCTPCLKEMPALSVLADHAPARVAVLGLAVNDRRDEVETMVDRLGVSYPTGYDSRGEIVDAAGVLRLPTTIVLAPDGRIIESHQGDADRDELEALLAAAARSVRPPDHASE